LAKLYTELERWNVAKRYVGLAKSFAKIMQPSIYWTQLLECAVQVDLALGLDVKADLQALKNRAADLPDYLQFKVGCLDVEFHLAKENLTGAKAGLAALKVSPLCQNGQNFEAVMHSVLSARLDLAEGCSGDALPKLKSARDWFAEDDVAVPLVNAQIYLAKGLMLDGKPDQAAAELDAARHYCETRNLSIQREKVEAAFATFDLSSRPLVENQRSISDSGWKNRQAYVVLERLGSGGQANVFRAHDNIRNKIVAIKKLKIRGTEALTALTREVRGANAADIDGIAHVIACGQDEAGEAYLVQEFIAGRSLRKMLEAGERPLQDVLTLEETLQALHRRGVSHGDVKPENVIVTPEGKVVLVDFGLAQIGGAKSLSGATQRYAPPSAAARWHDAKWRDNYAMGLMMIECSGVELPPLSRASWRDMFWMPHALQCAVNEVGDKELRLRLLRLLKPI
jgi:predicted Ser/Thr protein kinase